MNYLNLDIGIFILFLLGNLFVGLYRGKNIKTMREYAVGNRDFNIVTLVSTIVATWVGGGMLSNVLQKTYTEGLKFFISDLLNFLSFLFCYLLAPRMGEFLGSSSVAEVMGNLYGKHVKTITSIAGLIVSIGFVGIQFKVFGNLIGYFFEIPVIIAIILSGIVVVTYSCFGGIKSVAFTDILQFFTFIAFIPIIGFSVWRHCDSSFTDILNNSALLNTSEIFSSPQEMLIFATLTLYFALPAFYPAYFQRFAIAKNTFHLRKAFLIAAVILVVMKLLIAMVSIFLHSVDSTLNPSSLLGFIIDNYSYPGLKGIIITGIAALIMSTADSHINAASVIFTSEVLNRKKHKGSEHNHLKLCRITAIAIGMFSIFLAISNKNILGLMLMSASFYMPIVTVPLIFSIIGFRSSGRVVLLAMVAGFVTVIIWRHFFIDSGIDSVAPGMLANLICLFALHYILKSPGGWVGIKDKTAVEAIRYSRKKSLQKCLSFFKNFKLTEIFANNAPKNDITYTLFGIFAILSSISTIYTNTAHINIFYNMLVFMYQSMLIISAFFIVYPIWPPLLKNKKFSDGFWFLGTFYLLTFCSSFFVLLSDFAKFQIIIFTLNMVVIFMLSKWKTSVCMIFIGVFCATKLYNCLSFPSSSTINMNYYNIIYILLLISTAIVAFIIPKEKEQELFEFMNKELQKKDIESDKTLFIAAQHKETFFNNLNEKCVQLFRALNQESLEIYKNLLKCKTKEEILSKSKELHLIADKLKSGSDYLNRVISNFRNDLKMDLQKTSILQLVEQAIESNKYTANLKLFYNISINKETTINLNPELIKKVIYAFIEHGINHSSGNSLSITIAEDTLEYTLSFSDKLTSKRKAIQITLIFQDSNLQQHEAPDLTGSNVYHENFFQFAEVYKIINAHFGKHKIQATLNKELLYSFVIPCELKDLRPRKLDAGAGEYEKIYQDLNNKYQDNLKNIAKKLINEGISNYHISRATGLSLYEIDQLS